MESKGRLGPSFERQKSVGISAERCVRRDQMNMSTIELM